MKNDPKLVDLPRLRELVADLELGDSKRNGYLEARWLKYVEWWDSRARKAKWKYSALRISMVIAGAMIPALVGLRELNDWGPLGWIFSVASIVVSLVLAISTGIDSLFNYGDIWREKRAAAELIKSEFFSFYQRTGDYEALVSHEAAFPLFAANVEKLIRIEIKDYIVSIGEKPNRG